MELTVGVAVAYERLRSSERGQLVGAMVELLSLRSLERKNRQRRNVWFDSVWGNQIICCYIIVFEYISV